MSQITIAPQPGFQVKALSCNADIAILGASAGVGKSWLLLVDPLRYYDVKGFNGTIFRRTFPQINGPGGLWDKSEEIYPFLGGNAVKSDMTWKFKDSKIVFRHFQNEDDWINFQGSEMCYIAFDELTHFERSQFFKVFAWNRSKCGVKPYIRASCNPDPDSFVAQMVDWYIGEDGFPIPERDGVIRYFVTLDDNEIWGSSRDEVYEKSKHRLDLIPVEDKKSLIKSFSFIKGNIHDNRELLDNDPGYLANLMAMSEEEQLRFLKGNWKVKLGKELLFDHAGFKDCFTNDFVKRGKRYITADIATSGRDLLIISYWIGNRWEDIDIVDKNNGKEAIDRINTMRLKYEVQNSNIIFDADGVGGGMTGWIKNCVEFHANKTPFGKNDYKNLKSQCFFEASYCINQTHQKTKDDLYFISEKVANTKFDYDIPKIYKGRTIGWILEHQMKAIRKDKPDLGSDSKMSVIKKDEQKTYINGISPDVIEQLMLKQYFNIGNTEPIKVKVS
jgi:hypothetical protein